MYWWIRVHGAHAWNVLKNCARVASCHLFDIRGEFFPCACGHESFLGVRDLVLQAQVHVNNKASRA